MNYTPFVGPPLVICPPRSEMCITGGMNTADDSHLREAFRDSYQPLDAPECTPSGGMWAFRCAWMSLSCSHIGRPQF